MLFLLLLWPCGERLERCQLACTLSVGNGDAGHLPGQSDEDAEWQILAVAVTEHKFAEVK